MSTEQNKDKVLIAAKKPSRFAEAQKRAERMTAAGGPDAENPLVEFLKGAWSELKKTTWPSKEVLSKSVYVVLLLVFAVAIWVFAVDLVSDRVSQHLFATTSNQ
jgi:preprotein translocase SecE subunit